MNPATLSAYAAQAIRVKAIEWATDPEIYSYEFLELVSTATANQSRVETYAQIIMERRRTGDFSKGIYDKVLEDEFGYHDDMLPPAEWWPKGLDHGIQKIKDKYHKPKGYAK